MKQQSFLKKSKSPYGGELLNTREGRAGPRPLSTKHTMHLVLRSSKARGAWSFNNQENAKKIKQITDQFKKKYGVKILSLANVGNHLHFHLKLTNRYTYPAFIRALTAAIAMAVTKASKINPLKEKFWDYRPFTRIVKGLRAFLTMRDYIEINEIETTGLNRIQARFHLAHRKDSRRLAWRQKLNPTPAHT